MSAPDDPMTDDQAADALLDAIAEMRRDPCEELTERLRGLVKRWRAEATEMSRNRRNAAIAAAVRADADELERAIGDGR